MRARVPLLILAALAVAVAGCGTRERSNPFDPGNPSTRGQPVGFAATAGDRLVTLSWRPASAPDLQGFRVFRRGENESTFVPITSILSPGSSGYGDFGVPNGVTQHYQLYYVFFDGRSGVPATDLATPGPLKVWVADYRAGRLARVAPDGRRVADADPDFTAPSHVAINPVSGVVWASDAFAGRLVLTFPGSGTRLEISSVLSPGAIALDPVRGEGWVCDPTADLVRRFTEMGQPLSPSLGPVQDPLGIAVDREDGSVWVCDNAGNRVRHFTRTGGSLANIALDRPSRVAVDSLTRTAWITSFTTGRIYTFDPVGVPLDTFTVARGPIGVAIDPRRDVVWVADATSSELLRLAPDGTVLGRTGGVTGVTEIDVDPGSGEVWATSPSTGQVFRVGATGTLLRRLPGFSEPFGISVAAPSI